MPEQIVSFTVHFSLPLGAGLNSKSSLGNPIRFCRNALRLNVQGWAGILEAGLTAWAGT